MSIMIKTANGWTPINGTGVSKLTVENLPPQYHPQPIALAGAYQATGPFSEGWDWYEGREARRLAFLQNQVDVLNSIGQ